MARPRVFVSSTYYDLKHLRSSIENFVEQLGYEPVLSEKDSIAYLADAPLDESCYREAKSCDIFVLLVGGRYGSAATDQKRVGSKEDFYERYESITKREYESACERDVPTYILIDAAVDAEYQTFLKNKDNKSIKYAHVDSVNIFHFIESIRDKQRNNPVKLFSKYSEVEIWLREQWAGTFRELIQRMSAGSRIQDVDAKVADLTQTAETLKRYLEEVVSKVLPEKEKAVAIIKEENERLRQAKLDAEFRSFRYIQHLVDTHKKNPLQIRSALQKHATYPEFVRGMFVGPTGKSRVPPCACSSKAFEDLNGARHYLELSAYSSSELEAVRKEHKIRPSAELLPDLPEVVVTEAKPKSKRRLAP